MRAKSEHIEEQLEVAKRDQNHVAPFERKLVGKKPLGSPTGI